MDEAAKHVRAPVCELALLVVPGMNPLLFSISSTPAFMLK